MAHANQRIEDMEAALEAAQARLRALEAAQAERDRFFGLSPDMMVVAGIDGRLERVNPAFTAMLGYAPAEIVGRSIFDLLHPEDRDATLAELGRLKSGSPTRRFENRYRNKDGAYRLLEWMGSYEHPHIYAIARDITERRKQVLDWERRKLQMEEAQRLAHFGSFEADMVNQTNDWSDEMYRIFGIPIGQPVPMALVMSLTHPDDRPEALRIMADGAAGRLSEVDFEHRLIRPDGEERIFHLQAVFVRDAAGRVVKFIGAGQDVTERRALERQLARQVKELAQANAHKDQFLGILSHELRTPLNAIMGFASILDDGLAGPLTEEQATYMAKILESSGAMLALVNDLLDMSRVQAGKLRLGLQPVPLSPLLNDTLQALAPVAESRQHTLSSDVPADLPVVQADPQRVSQILENLVSNAAKYSPPGGAIRVSARREDGCVRVEVADTGIGIPESEHERIFQPFTQVDMSDTRQRGGVGLGLSIVKALVEAHQGHIGVQSRPARGSTFWFTLPVD